MTAQQTPPPAPVEYSQSASPLTNPNLSAALRAEYEALLHDVEQAHEMSAEFQRQLAGKADEVAEFKQLFEKTQTDLVRLQGSITALREERHRLANDAMRATALSRKLAEVTAERDWLIADLERTKQGHTTDIQEAGQIIRERDAVIEKLSLEVAELGGQSPASHDPKGGNDVGVKVVLSEMWQTLERLQTVLDPLGASTMPTRQTIGAAAQPVLQSC
jgi:DNA repair exonuclease SbcCD ATPase subunit